MRLRELLHDDNAVSPVIGVILMVAITVILAAVIGSFTLGLGDQVQTSPPRASFGFDSGTTDLTVYNYSDNGPTQLSIKYVTITHESGDTVDANNLEVSVNGKAAYTSAGDVANSDGEEVGDTFSGDVSSGSSITIIAAADSSSITTGSSAYTTNSGDRVLDIDSQLDRTGDITDVGLSSGETVRVTYDSPDSDNTATLAKYEIP